MSRGVRGRSERRRWPGLVGLALLALPCAARAQQPTAAPPMPVVTGMVLDANTGKPIAYARVGPEQGEPHVLSDSTGAFRLGGLPPGVANLTAVALGYAHVTLPVAVAPDVEPVAFRLFPDPVAIKGITVMSDRFRRRRNALTVSALGYDRELLLKTTAIRFVDFIEDQAHVSTVDCPGRQPGTTCIIWRGQAINPEVYLDERPLPGGLNQLSGYDPRDFYLVEVINQGYMIRAYTQQFADRLAHAPRNLDPIVVR